MKWVTKPNTEDATHPVTFKNVLKHFPLLVTFRGLWWMYKLYSLDYGMDSFKSKNHAAVEKILKESNEANMIEVYFHEAPNFVLRLINRLSTGRLAYFDIPASLFYQGMAASRAYFLLRSKDTADAIPYVFIVFLRIFPCMSVVTMNSLIFWTIIGGLLGPYTFFAVGLNYVIVRLVLSASETSFLQRTSLETNKESESFNFKAAIFSVWSPCTVGNQKWTFLISSIASLVAKVVLLATAVCLAYSGLLPNIHKNHFLLWCHSNETRPMGSDIEMCSFSNGSCFSDIAQNITQKMRLCEPHVETPLRLCILAAVIISSLFYLLATYRLHRLSDFLVCYRETKTLMWFVPTEPYVHRSLLLKMINEGEIQYLKEVLETTNSLSLNGQDILGNTPLMVACKIGSEACTSLLVVGVGD